MTRKPCPGCGLIISRRPANEVCSACKTLMDDGRAWRKQREDAGRTKALCLLTPYMWYEGNCTHETRQRLAQAMHLLQRLVSVPATTDADKASKLPRLAPPLAHLDSYGAYYCTVVAVTPEVLKAFQELDDAIRTAMVEAEKRGRQEGSSALMALARNEITVDDFNAAATGRDVRKLGEPRRK